MAEFKVLFEKVIDCVERNKLPYAIVGGFAAILRGRARTTTDIDLVIDASIEQILIFLDLGK